MKTNNIFSCPNFLLFKLDCNVIIQPTRKPESSSKALILSLIYMSFSTSGFVLNCKVMTQVLIKHLMDLVEMWHYSIRVQCQYYLLLSGRFRLVLCRDFSFFFRLWNALCVIKHGKIIDTNTLRYLVKSFEKFEKFRKIYRKAHVMEPLLIKKVSGTLNLGPRMWC